METEEKPKYQQATRITRKFITATRLAQLCGFNKSTVTRWAKPKPKGSDGIIPVHSRPIVERVAKENGIKLTKKDWEFS